VEDELSKLKAELGQGSAPAADAPALGTGTAPAADAPPAGDQGKEGA
jgi:hypothetical protein